MILDVETVVLVPSSILELPPSIKQYSAVIDEVFQSVLVIAYPFVEPIMLFKKIILVALLLLFK